jgi:hypothetical protein
LLPRYYFLLLRIEMTGDQRGDTSPSGRKRCTVTGQTSLVVRCDFTQIIVHASRECCVVMRRVVGPHADTLSSCVALDNDRGSAP